MPAPKQPPACTLIITTYNWPDALEKVLQTVAWQTVLPHEVFIADDGSSNATESLISRLQDNFPVPLRHFWQEDKKKRKTRINNIAIAQAANPYLIFVDHDVLLHPAFIQDHLTLAEPGYFLNGSRYLLSPASTNNLLQQKRITLDALRKADGINPLNRKRIPLLMRLLAHKYQTKDQDTFKVRGCNMSFWREDLIAVNGYDEYYQGWGREDSDIALRLFHMGIRKKSLKFGGVEYHLHHKEGDKMDDTLYMERLKMVQQEKRVKAPVGLNQHML